MNLTRTILSAKATERILSEARAMGISGTVRAYRGTSRIGRPTLRIHLDATDGYCYHVFSFPIPGGYSAPGLRHWFVPMVSPARALRSR